MYTGQHENLYKSRIKGTLPNQAQSKTVPRVFVISILQAKTHMSFIPYELGSSVEPFPRMAVRSGLAHSCSNLRSICSVVVEVSTEGG